MTKVDTISLTCTPKHAKWHVRVYARLIRIWTAHRRVQSPKDLRLARDAGISDHDFYLQNLKLPSKDWQHPRL